MAAELTANIKVSLHIKGPNGHVGAAYDCVESSLLLDSHEICYIYGT